MFCGGRRYRIRGSAWLGMLHWPAGFGVAARDQFGGDILRGGGVRAGDLGAGWPQLNGTHRRTAAHRTWAARTRAWNRSRRSSLATTANVKLDRIRAQGLVGTDRR